jgi:aspartyl-tRNA(Asn)/glutamyl-tRNA(Gln) amidotransferase subunit A
VGGTHEPGESVAGKIARVRAESVPDPTRLEGIFLARPDPLPVDGIRLAVKDLFDTAGLTTTYGSILFADHVPERSAEAVLLLEAAGYVNVGKTNLHEFAYGVTSQNPHFGTVPNPIAPGRIAGGSSGGSAAALAAGLADAAIGSDSGGSIRIPAACCGIVGLKPTYGLVPLDGCFPLAPTFDHAGPMARTVGECAALLEALAPGFRPAAAPPLVDLRVGVAWLEHCDPLVRERIEAAVSLFPDARAVDLPTAADVGPLFQREVADVHRDLFAESGESYGANVRAKIERCLEVTDAAAAEAARKREHYRELAEHELGGLELLLVPTLSSVAPPVPDDERSVREALIRFTFPFNALGWPALALPAGPAEAGLPASLQLVGRPGDDALVLAVGESLEASVAVQGR